MYYIKVNSEIYFENKQTYSVSMQSLYLPFYFFLYYASVILQILKTMAVHILPHLFFGFFLLQGKDCTSIILF